MRFLVAFVLALGIALVSAQTTSDSNSWTPSWTNSVTPSWTNTNSNSNSGSITGTGTGTGTSSGTGTATRTFPQPAAPISLTNGCPNHIQYICPVWSDPPGFSFDLYHVYYSAAGGPFVLQTSSQDSARIGPGLLPNTAYTVQVSGTDTSNGVWSANSTASVFTTSPADPKLDPSLDISNFACAQGKNPNTGRTSVTCSWTAATDTVIHVNLKAHCVSATREPLLVRKKLWGAKAVATSVLFAINRDSATCNFYARFYYARRPTTRHHVKLVVS